MSEWKNRIVSHDNIDPKMLIENPFNMAIHTDMQKQLMTGVFDEIGWLQSVIVNTTTNHIIDGHMRISLAIKNNQDSVPVSYVELDDEEEKKALMSINPIAMMVVEKKEKVEEILRSISPNNKDFGVLLKSIADRNRIAIEKLDEDYRFNGEDIKDEDFSEPDIEIESVLPKNTYNIGYGDVVEFGDGDGYILCCDFTTYDLFKDCMNKANIDKVDMVFTSPPYAEQRKDTYGGIPENKYVNWWGIVQGIVGQILNDDGSFFINIKSNVNKDGQRSLYVMKMVIAMVEEHGWKFIDELMWYKQSMPKQVIKRFKNRFEPIYQFSKSSNFKFEPKSVMTVSENVPTRKGQGTGPTTWSKYQGNTEEMDKHNASLEKGDYGLAYPSNVISVNYDKASGHSAAFPIALPDFFIRAYSTIGDIVCDIFSGSGTVGVASYNNGRKFLLIEKLPEYVSVAIDKIKQETKLEHKII